MSSWPRNVGVAQRAQHCLGFGSQIVAPLILSLVSADSLRGLEPSPVCACLLCVCSSAVLATVSRRLCKLVHCKCLCSDWGPSLALGGKDDQTLKDLQERPQL